MRFYLNGIGIAGRNGIPRVWWITTGTRSPRGSGLRSDLTGHQKTVLRGGAGLFYERLAGNEDVQPGPKHRSVLLISPPRPTCTSTIPRRAIPPDKQRLRRTFPANIWTVDPRYKIPTAAQWSLGIQHQLRQNAVLSVTYVGNSNYHQSQGRNINPLCENDTTPLGRLRQHLRLHRACVECQPLPALSGLGTIAPMEMAANSNYNSLQVALRVTAWKNLTFNSAYTWSHAFDIIDGEIFSNVSNPFNVRWDYGPAGFDRRQISVTSFIYQVSVLPERIQPGRQDAAGRMGTLRHRHLRVRNTRFRIGAGPDNLGLGGAPPTARTLSRPSRTRGPVISGSARRRSEAGPLQWGTSARNTVVSPGRNNWNMSLFKAFQFTERARFEFRAETYNTFNHTQFNGLSTGVTNTDFGQLNGAFAPRIFQLGAKLMF